MTYTEEMTTSEILLRLASMRNELLQAVNDIEKISKNICYKVEQTGPQTDCFFRNPTAEERKAIADYIDSISVSTGVNVFDLMDEPQTDIHDLTDCDFCKDRNCKNCEGGKDESQTDTITFTYTEEEWNEIQDWKDRMWAETVIEPQTEYDKYREKIRPHDPHKDWFEGGRGKE